MLKMKLISYTLSLATLFVTDGAWAVRDPDVIGAVKTATGEAEIVHDGHKTTAALNSKLYNGDTLVTRSNSSVGIIFIDGAVMSLGPNSQFQIEGLIFKPEQKTVAFSSNILKGSMSFISGAIGRIAPGNVRIKTPTTTLGLRGTKILVEVK